MARLNTLKQVLEQYVFNVSNCYIESAEPATQQQLIQLLGKIADSPDDTPSPTDLADSPPFEWEPILSQPVDWHSVHRQWLAGIIRQPLGRHKRYATQLAQAVEMTQRRLEQLPKSQLQEPGRTNLEAYYQQALASYQRLLEQALTTSSNF